MRNNLKRLEEFLDENELKINIGKTAIVENMIKQKKGKKTGNPPTLEVTETTGEKKMILDKGEIRILGTNIQQNLGWNKHLENGTKSVLPAARKQFGSLQQLSKMLPRSSKKLLAEGLVLSKIMYNISQWGGATQNHIKTVQRFQNKVARWVTGCGKRTRITSLLRETGWLSITDHIKIQSLVQLWKVLHLRKPETISEELTLNEDNVIEIRKPRLQFTEYAFKWRTTNDWNELPNEIRELKTLLTFKRRLKKWMREQQDQEPD